MKLRVWHRIALFVGALLCLAVGIGLLIAGLQFNEIPIRQEGEGFFTINRLIILLMGLVTVLFALFTLSLPSRMKAGKSNFVLQKTGSGEMRISVQAIESIVNKSISEYKEIKLRDLAVQSARDGVVISMKVDLADNVNIPLAVEAMQKHITKQVRATTGIEVKEVRILVESADTIVGDSPFAVKREELAFPPKQAPEEPEKEESSHA
ncbi:MAG: alkaline shock response membrane anchor protein AmaP [Eubacteriales bacterium]|nr:alkaline shock response membrane anchor protein AmaP [Eubacteriales bacterium]